MSYFVAGLTNVDPNIRAPVYKRYHHVQYNDVVPASATASVSFPPSDVTFRYVVIQQQFLDNNAICLTEVKVFLRGNLLYHTHRSNITLLGLCNEWKCHCQLQY